MREKFPFYKPSKGTNSGMNINSGWANLNQQQSGAWSGGNNYNMNTGFNNQGFNNQGFNNQGFNNQGFFNQGFNNVGGNGAYQNNQPPIPFNSGNQNIHHVISNGQKFVGESKKIMDKLKSENAKAI